MQIHVVDSFFRLLEIRFVAVFVVRLREKNICPKWAQNGPFELSAGHREHRERVRSLDLRQFEPPKTFPGLKNVKKVTKKLGDPVS